MNIIDVECFQCNWSIRSWKCISLNKEGLQFSLQNWFPDFSPFLNYTNKLLVVLSRLGGSIVALLLSLPHTTVSRGSSSFKSSQHINFYIQFQAFLFEACWTLKCFVSSIGIMFDTTLTPPTVVALIYGTLMVLWKHSFSSRLVCPLQRLI